MKARGRKTVVEYVDVDALQFIDSIFAKSIPYLLDHLSSDGYWYVLDGMDYHKNDEMFSKARKATEEEIELKNAYDEFRKFVKDSKLL